MAFDYVYFIGGKIAPTPLSAVGPAQRTLVLNEPWAELQTHASSQSQICPSRGRRS